MMNLAEKLKSLPDRPGVYVFKNAAGEVLYVGKAKILKNRVRSYFQNQTHLLPRTQLLIQEIADLDYAIVSSETESLILESNLIKQYQPRFNVRLRDDKNYQFIKIDYDAQIPQVLAVRKIDKGRRHARYFGPYTSGTAVKQTLKLLKRVFSLCSNKKITKRACFQYHLGRCPGVCIGKISPAEYRRALRAVEEFLNHKQTAVLKLLKSEMLAAAAGKQFEKAAGLRDKMRSLMNIWERQKIIFPRRVSADYFSLFRNDNQGIVNLFMVREGKLIHQENFEILQTAELPGPLVLQSFLEQYYAEASNFPKEIVASEKLPDPKLFQKWLKAKVLLPRRGQKLALLRLSLENAKEYYQKNFASVEAVLAGLQKFLGLPGLPRRIEAYDISNIQGVWPVGSMVVFENGQAKKNAYRKFKIRGKHTPDDFAMMQEMLTRRLAHQNEKHKWPAPDLLVIDGGKGQLNVVLKILTTYNLQLPVIGLAKRLEEIFTPQDKLPRRLPPNSPMLFLLQRIRDEAHRFAITFYRSRHRQEGVRSSLDDALGIGEVTRKKLLKKFGSLAQIRQARPEALAKAIGKTRAKLLKKTLERELIPPREK